MDVHPIRIVCEDDLRRTRVTVFFRWLLAIPHYIWVLLWGIAAFLVAIANWAVTLVRGESPRALHDFLARYLAYTVHVEAYLYLAANPYPPFDGGSSYPVHVEIAPPAPQNRWLTGFRLFLFLPALLVSSALAGLSIGFSAGRGASGWMGGYNFGLASAAAFLGWFASLATGRMPRGLRDVSVYSLGYSAQAWGYAFCLTDRYPDARPSAHVEGTLPPHPVRVSNADDLRRSRLTTFFRLPLAVPHIIWLLLWSAVVLLASIAAWILTLVRGTLPEPLRRFFTAYLRYGTHVTSFLYLVANPFPGFVGAPGYPVDAAVDPPGRQNRWVTGFRALLAVPAVLMSSAVDGLLTVAAILAWFYALATGRMTPGLQAAGVYAVRYQTQVSAYLLFLTERYPYSGPQSEQPAPEASQLAAAAAVAA